MNRNRLCKRFPQGKVANNLADHSHISDQGQWLALPMENHMELAAEPAGELTAELTGILTSE